MDSEQARPKRRYLVPCRCWKVEVLLSILESLRLVSPLTLLKLKLTMTILTYRL